MGIQKAKCNMTVNSAYRKAEKHKKPLDHSDEQDISGKTVVITGANSGVGEAAALEFAKRGAIVVMPCRNIEKAEKVVQDIKSKVPDAKLDLLKLDLGDLKSVRKCAQEIQDKYTKIHILVNNAGFSSFKKELDVTDGLESHMLVNHLGPHLFTHLLLDLLKNGTPSRIVFTTSMAFQMGELDPADFMLEKRGNFAMMNFGAYSNAKLATNYCVKILAKKLEGTGVNVYALCPGFVKSGFQGDSPFMLKIFTNLLAIKPEEGAENILYCSLMNSVANQTGLMYRTNGLWEGAMDELDDAIGQQVWDKSDALVGASA